MFESQELGECESPERGLERRNVPGDTGHRGSRGLREAEVGTLEQCGGDKIIHCTLFPQFKVALF